MPIDLHRHLEGSHSPAALAEVAARYDVRDPVFYDVERRRHRTAEELVGALVMAGPSDDASLFYACITKARAAYVSEEAIAELARRAFVEAAQDTDGFEMRLSLFSMTRTLLENQGVAWRELPPARFADRARGVLLAVLQARDEARASCDKPMLVRLGLSRTFESGPHYDALAEMVRDHKASLTGLDVLGIVGGDGSREPMPDGLRRILVSLRGDFPDLTIHAGEFEDHGSIERTLELEPQAIGHGVHAVGSDACMRRLSDLGVTLEVCPTSNRLLIPTALARLHAGRGEAPLVALQQAAVHTVLGSDDPTPMGTTFAAEWAHAAALGADLDRLRSDVARRWAQLPGSST